jgi:RepB DNA-primase from phage plasmid
VVFSGETSDSTGRNKNLSSYAPSWKTTRCDEVIDRSNAQTNDAVPSPTAVIHTSTGKHQVIWRVKGFTIPEQEVMLKGLAETFGGDRGDSERLRISGRRVESSGPLGRNWTLMSPSFLDRRRCQS